MSLLLTLRPDRILLPPLPRLQLLPDSACYARIVAKELTETTGQGLLANRRPPNRAAAGIEARVLKYKWSTLCQRVGERCQQKVQKVQKVAGEDWPWSSKRNWQKYQPRR